MQANPFIDANAQLLRITCNQVVQIRLNQEGLHNCELIDAEEVVQIRRFTYNFAKHKTVFRRKSCADRSFIEGFTQPPNK